MALSHFTSTHISGIEYFDHWYHTKEYRWEKMKLTSYLVIVVIAAIMFLQTHLKSNILDFTTKLIEKIFMSSNLIKLKWPTTIFIGFQAIDHITCPLKLNQINISQTQNNLFLQVLSRSLLPPHPDCDHLINYRGLSPDSYSTWMNDYTGWQWGQPTLHTIIAHMAGITKC